VMSRKSDPILIDTFGAEDVCPKACGAHVATPILLPRPTGGNYWGKIIYEYDKEETRKRKTAVYRESRIEWA